jgi:hypothetical protein
MHSEKRLTWVLDRKRSLSNGRNGSKAEVALKSKLGVLARLSDSPD